MRKLRKIIKIDDFKIILQRIYGSTGHDVHNIIIYNNVSHNFQFLSCFLNINRFVGINEYIS